MEVEIHVPTEVPVMTLPNVAFFPSMTLKGMLLASSRISVNLRPMRRFAEYTVLRGFVTAWRFAAWPTTRSPVFVKATTDGVVRAPSAFGTTTGSPASMTAMQEFVVPKSMPRMRLMAVYQQRACPDPGSIVRCFSSIA